MTPLAYVQVARTYRIAFRRCEEQRPLPGGKIEMPLMPGVVCGVFAVELALKGLLLHRGKSTRIHDLSKLFGYLPETDQESIISGLAMERAIFLSKLNEIRDGYVRWRYFFEHSGLSIDITFVRSLADTTISVAQQSVAA